MARREDLGSWLEGTPDDPGARAGLGVAGEGPGSLARLPRRLGALALDWLLSMGVSGLFFPVPGAGRGLFAGAPLATIAVFGLTSALLVGLLGHTIGHRVAGLRVLRVRDVRAAGVGAAPEAAAERVAVSPPPGPVAGLVRSVLLCMVIPAVVWDRDGRGLHDVAAGTVLVTR